MELQFKQFMAHAAHDVDTSLGKITGINGNDHDGLWITTKTKEGIRHHVQLSYSGFKLHLRPLSDLTKEIDYNGKTYEYLEWLRTFCICDAEHDFIDACQDCPPSIDEKLKVCPYNLIQKLLEWHFDVFGLIEKGLAIDMNTLKVKS